MMLRFLFIAVGLFGVSPAWGHRGLRRDDKVRGKNNQKNEEKAGENGKEQGDDSMNGATTLEDVDTFCPCLSDWQNHGQYVSCVARASKGLAKAERLQIMRQAAQSDCGQSVGNDGDDDGTIISGTVDSTGGLLSSSDDIFSIEFPPGSFLSSTDVSVKNITDATLAGEFDFDAEIYRPAVKLDYALEISMSSPPQTETVKVFFQVPEAFLSNVPSTDTVRLFAKILQTQTVSHVAWPLFELINACVLDASDLLTCDLPGNAFADYGNGEVAILTLASTVGVGTQQTRRHDRSLEECDANSIQCPIGGGMGCGDDVISSSYQKDRLHPTLGVMRDHLGTDFAIPVGTPILAVADGVIEVAKFSSTLGNMIILRAGSSPADREQNGFRYGHLDSIDVSAGDVVQAGDQIGLSGNTGSATSGPHLHFEYAPSGALFNNPDRIDPVPCIGSFQGSITVGDNGALADDAFSLFLNGNLLGSTTIGATNNIGVGNLIPGEYTLAIEIIIAPDGCGTYSIQLNDGITFSDGTTSRSRFGFPEGTIDSFTIIVPSN